MTRIYTKLTFTTAIIGTLTFTSSEVLSGKLPLQLSFLEEIGSRVISIKPPAQIFRNPVQKAKVFIEGEQFSEEVGIKTFQVLSPSRKAAPRQFKEFHNRDNWITGALPQNPLFERTSYSLHPTSNRADKDLPFFSRRFYSTNNIDTETNDSRNLSVKQNASHNQPNRLFKSPSPEKIKLVPKEPIPSLKIDDSFKEFNRVTDKFCHKTIGLIDEDLSKCGENATKISGYLGDNEDEDKSVHIQLHRGFTDGLDDLISKWESRLKELITMEILEISNDSIKVSQEFSRQLFNDGVEEDQVNKNIPAAINNYNTFFKKSYSSLYNSNIYSSWPYYNINKQSN